MDIASLLGVLIGVACLGVVLFEASHGHLVMFYSLEGVLMVGGGSLSVCLMAMPIEKIRAVPGYLRRFMFKKTQSQAEVVRTLASLSEKARRDGVLSLESDLQQVSDPFLAAGMRMVIDGIDPTDIETVLNFELMAMQERHKAGKKFFDLIKLYGPGWGLVGTLVGQVGMLGNLGSGDISIIGHMLAIAVVATMYGTIVANAIAGPIGDKLALRSSEEILNRRMMLQGILSIQAGDNPRVTQDKLLAFIPQVRREAIRSAA